jgi:hypothetical protein
MQEAIRCLNSKKASLKPNLDNIQGLNNIVKWLELLSHLVQGLRYLII